MIVVADTSPFNYLILIDSIDVLPALYQHVLVPHAVMDEMLSPFAPAKVRVWAQNPPDWLTTLSPSGAPTQFSAILDAGESQAIQLAEEINADWLLIDESAGRREARKRGLKLVGTLGILSEAHQNGFLDFTVATNLLRQTNFRLSLKLLEEIKRGLF